MGASHFQNYLVSPQNSQLLFLSQQYICAKDILQMGTSQMIKSQVIF